ncbi:hydrolase [Sulfurimonas sp.]
MTKNNDKVFTPAFGLNNRHIQTIFPSLFRKPPPLTYEIEKFSLSDGDFLECYWYKIKTHTKTTPIAILFHGLAGSYKSSYIQGVIHAFQKADISSVVMHYRGCGAHENLKPRSYHSGDTQDAKEFLDALHTKHPKSKLFGVGYSLGANMLLKFLGEMKNQSPIEAAVAISAPMQLDVCASRMNKGFSKFYQYLLLKDLNKALEKKYIQHDLKSLIGLPKEKVRLLKSFWEFDDAYTAPIHGFASAKEYYEKSSAKQYLKNIQTPTLIIHALDDPFMTPEILPNKEELSPFVSLEVQKNGGHVGFVGGTLLRPEYWLDKRVLSYLTTFL